MLTPHSSGVHGLAVVVPAMGLSTGVQLGTVVAPFSSLFPIFSLCYFATISLCA